jgi:quercetin dioxygenase-like cupin family protein
VPRPAPAEDDDTAAFHVLRRDVGPFRVAHNRYPAQHHIPQHEHHTATIYLVLTGGHVERSRSDEVDCARGSVVFSPPGTRHSDAYGTDGGEALLIDLPRHVLDSVREAGAELTEPVHVASGASRAFAPASTILLRNTSPSPSSRASAACIPFIWPRRFAAASARVSASTFAHCARARATRAAHDGSARH